MSCAVLGTYDLMATFVREKFNNLSKMIEIYTVIVAILALLAVIGLFVGVTNDAVNFLNSAIGSKVASMRVILGVASAGILLGVISSSGMMEVARSGMFNPAMFSFHEVMTLYLGVMFANIILLDLYNSWGLPTSTTVSLIFCLLGAAVAVSFYKIGADDTLTISSLGDFINTSRAMGIVSAILLSVVIAFFFGTLIMYISRAIFSFRYIPVMNRFGALWCGMSLTAILYFALFKGLKNAIARNEVIQMIDQHLLSSLLICWVACSLVLFFLQHFKINILRITILSGTFALALAFAGNDLVNFIGVPIAGFDAYSMMRETGDVAMNMHALAEDKPANFLLLLIAGIVMIITLWKSKKAMHVTETELSLAAARDGEGNQQYGSSFLSRSIVRLALNFGKTCERIVPAKIRERMARKFEYADIEHSGAPFDMIRATVNLTTSALLISLATSLKLPLSTTYVCFMVAMGSSLADRAWGRESAVYRISGVMTVIAGWFVTALGGFIIALLVGLVLIYGGMAAFAVVTVLAAWMLYRSNKSAHKSEEGETRNPSAVCGVDDTACELRQELIRTMVRATHIYDRTLIAVMRENRRELKNMMREANDLFQTSREHKYTLLPILKKVRQGDVNTAHFYVQAVDYLNELTKALLHITRPSFEHIDNNHEGLSKDQARDLMAVNDEVEQIYRQINGMLNGEMTLDVEAVLAQRDGLFEMMDGAVEKELARLNRGEVHTKASLLYLSILSETKNMVLQSRNLLKAQEDYLRNCREE